MTAAAVAALTVYDMTKALNKGITIREVRLESKSAERVGTSGGRGAGDGIFARDA